MQDVYNHFHFSNAYSFFLVYRTKVSTAWKSLRLPVGAEYIVKFHQSSFFNFQTEIARRAPNRHIDTRKIDMAVVHFHTAISRDRE